MTIDKAQEDAHRLAMVIDMTNGLETQMKHVIATYSKIPPDRIDFFHSHIANNSIMSFGSKVKVVLAIAKSMNVPVEKNGLHVLLSRRNAFAHQDAVNAIRLSENLIGETTALFVVESIKGNGELETVTREQAYMEFGRALFKAEREINFLLKVIIKQNQIA